MTTTALETRRPPTGPGFADAVTFSFADPERDRHGLARIGLADGKASALAILFEDREPGFAFAAGDADIPVDADWSLLSAHGLTTTTEQPLERWTVTHERFDLTFAAISAPAAVGEAVATAGGMQGYEQLCTVTGTVDGDAVDGLGQRGHTWGAPDWERLELARNVSAWLGPEHGGVALGSIRPAGAAGHDEEAVWASVVESGEPVAVAGARLSTTYDADGRHRRAGLELWIREDDSYPYRASGEVLCGSTLDLGQLRIDLAFLRWHAEGHEGVGRYDVIRRSH